jgi:hypothetical protein
MPKQTARVPDSRFAVLLPHSQRNSSARISHAAARSITAPLPPMSTLTRRPAGWLAAARSLGAAHTLSEANGIDRGPYAEYLGFGSVRHGGVSHVPEASPTRGGG